MRVADSYKQRLTLSERAQEESPESRFLILLLYYTVFHGVLQLIGGENALSGSPLSFFVTATPFVISALWFHAFAMSKRHGMRSKQVRRLPLVFPVSIYLFGVATLFGTFLGYQEHLGQTLDELVALSKFWATAFIAFYTITSQSVLNVILKKYLSLLFVLAVARLINHIISWVTGTMLFHEVWTDNLMIGLAFTVTLSRFLAERQLHRRDFLTLFFIAASVLIALDKPIVWSTVLAMLFVLLLHLVKMGNITNMTRLAPLLLVFLVVLGLFNVITGGEVLAQYQHEIDTRYLKIDPSTGERPEGIPLDGGRLWIWEDAYERFEQKPFFGEGFGAVSNFKNSEHDLRGFAIHNVLLHFLLTTGLTGTAPLIMLLLAWLVMTNRGLVPNTEFFAERLGLSGYVIFILAFAVVGTIWLGETMYVFGFVCGASLKSSLMQISDEGT
ncbi:MAG: O-antigen ligase family protein [Anaerolineae bacterium]|nr:O-antigen ligase family protein [Anaerolineae bacterium]